MCQSGLRSSGLQNIYSFAESVSVPGSWRSKLYSICIASWRRKENNSIMSSWLWKDDDQHNTSLSLLSEGVSPSLSPPMCAAWCQCPAFMCSGDDDRSAWDGAWEWCLCDRTGQLWAVSVRSTVGSEHHPKVNFQKCDGTRHDAHPMRARYRMGGPMRAE